MNTKTRKMTPGYIVWLCEAHDPNHSHYDLPSTLDGAIADIVFLRKELQKYFAATYDSAKDLRDEVARWRRLYLDKPEDRLWHASDNTWWTRKDDTLYGVGGLFAAEPPEPVKKLMKAHARLVKSNAALRAQLAEVSLKRKVPRGTSKKAKRGK